MSLNSYFPSIITTALQNGNPYGVLSLLAISSCVCIPITQYKKLYGISVGYGMSVTIMTYILRQSLNASTLTVTNVLTNSAIFYGMRLAIHLLIRDVTGYKPLSNTDDSRIKRIPFAISLGLFYSFLVTPIMYTLRIPPTTPDTWQYYMTWFGTGLSILGAIVEAIADTHKFIVKASKDGDTSNFCGPTTGLYTISRHPNYLGEIIFWVGIYIAGVPSFGKSIIAWLCSTAGVYGIVSIMKAATKGLEKRQIEKYNGQEKYENWKKNVKAPLFPFIKG